MYTSNNKATKYVKEKLIQLRDLWDNIKHNNIRIIGVPEGEKKETKDPRKEERKKEGRKEERKEEKRKNIFECY